MKKFLVQFLVRKIQIQGTKIFQKKSKSGIATPKQELTLIKNRLKEAKALYKGMEDNQ